MSDPLDRPDPASITEATRLAVKTDRARVVAAEQAARRRRSSVWGRFEQGSRWLRNRRSGPLARLRRVASVLRFTVRAGGLWRSLPESIASALLAPVHLPGKPASPQPPRDWGQEQAAAAGRLAAAGPRLLASDSRSLIVAVIADEPALAALAGACRVVPVRPEDWASTLEAMGNREAGDAATAGGPGLDLLVVTPARHGTGGSWAYRIGWHAHPDSFLHRDLAALLGWCAARGIPSVFVARESGEPSVRMWADAARLFDLVLAPDPETAAAFDAVPDRMGAGSRALAPGSGLDGILAAVGAGA